MGSTKLIRLGIVDDHPVFRFGLRGALERHKDLTVRWDLDSATELLETVGSSPVDVVLMDLDLGQNQDGLTATRSLKRAHPGVQVIVITASLDNESVTAARRAGASGYLAKDLPVADMLVAIRRLGAGPTRAAVGDYLAGGAAAGDTRLRGLTKREHEVLAELKQGRTNREIASRLGVSVTTVNKHVQHVLKKLHVKTRGQAVARLNGETTTRVFQSS